MFSSTFAPGKLHRVLVVVFLLSLPLVNPIVHGDGVGYYAYARAPLIQHNFHFEDDWRRANLNFSQSHTRPDGQLLPEEYTETGYVSNLFTIGPAILWAPFLLLAHGMVHLLQFFGAHITADGFSFPYIFAMAFGTAVYGFLGLLVSFNLAKKYIDERWALVATIAIWWASSLPVYMYFNPAWSHAHSAFAAALFLWYWDRTSEGRSTLQWLWLGLIAGLMVDIYFPNSIFLLLPLVESLLRYYRDLKTRPAGMVHLLMRNLLFVATILFAFLPTILTRRIIFGGYFRFGSYSHLSWDWSAPHWRAVLFSPDHGVFSWTPLLAVALLGLAFAPRSAKSLALYLALAAFSFYYLISSYPYWDGLASFGNRFFISLTPVYVFGLAALLQRSAAWFKSRRLALILSSSVLACFIVWNLGFIYQWGAHLIPARGPISFRDAAYNQFFVVPEKITGHLRTYIFRRHQLMLQIEQKDIEELKKDAQP